MNEKNIVVSDSMMAFARVFLSSRFRIFSASAPSTDTDTSNKKRKVDEEVKILEFTKAEIIAKPTQSAWHNYVSHLSTEDKISPPIDASLDHFHLLCHLFFLYSSVAS